VKSPAAIAQLIMRRARLAARDAVEDTGQNQYWMPILRDKRREADDHDRRPRSAAKITAPQTASRGYCVETATRHCAIVP